VKEAQASVLRMDAGLSTLEQECADQGTDWEDNVNQRKIERDRFEALGLPYPTWFGQELGSDQQDVAAAKVAAKPQRPQPE